MTCISPKIAYWYYAPIINEKTGEIYNTKHLRFKISPKTTIDDVLNPDKQYTFIPCGKCEGCKIDHANDFSTRAYLESLQYKQNCFVTLTYDNKHIPKNRSLNKRDFQLFLKRLRKHLEPQKIRYLLCGEYGPRTLRCHAHLCIFNYFPSDAQFYKKNLVGDYLYTSEELNKIWGNGYVIVGNLSYESACYVARYVMKKAYGIDKDFYLKHNRQPEFILSSRRPGIGATIIGTKQWETIKNNYAVFIKSKFGLKTRKIPTFLRNKWKDLENREEYFRKSDERARALKQNTRARLKNTDLKYYQYQQLTKEIQAEKLKRLDKRQDI